MATNLVRNNVGIPGAGGGILYPESADRPFSSNSARNTWANNNKSDLIKDTTVVNVGGSQWYLWTGESDPTTVSSSLWMDANQIVQGQPGNNGSDGSDGVSIDSVTMNQDGELIVSKDDGTSNNVGRVLGLSSYEFWLSQGNVGTEQDYLDSLKGEKGDDGDITANASANELLKVNSKGEVVGTGIFSEKDGSAKFDSGSIDIGHHTISSAGEGVEATNASSGESYSFVFAGQGDDTGPVDRIVDSTLINLETTTDKSKQLTNHVSRVEALQYFRLVREPITIESVSAQTNVTMRVRSLSGDDIWSFGPFDLPAGTFQFTPDTILDFKIGQYDVEFTSPDGDVTLVGGVNPVTGNDIFYGILPTKLFTDETLHNIKHGTDIVRTVEAGSNVTLTTDVDGKLTISSTSSGGGGSTLDVDGNETEVIETGTGITSAYDAPTKTTTLTVDPTSIDLSDYAKLNEANEFTVTQTIKDADLHITKADDSELFTVKQNIDTAEVKGTLKAVDVKSTIVDSGQNSNLLLKHNGVSKVYVGDTSTTIQDNLQLNNGATTAISNVTQDTSLTNKEYVDQGDVYRGKGLGIQDVVYIASTSVEQNEPVTQFSHDWGNSSSVTIDVDNDLDGFESIIYLPADMGPGAVSYSVIFNSSLSSQTVRRGETWVCKGENYNNQVNMYWSKVDAGLQIVQGLADRNIEVTDPAIKLFQYADSMPYHLLIETPGTATEAATARLVHKFPRSKTFVFSPNATGRTYVADVVVNQTNQNVATADLDLGEYDDLPLYVMEPNVVINRDQRASISYPANMTIDVSNGFYVFGTISGRCGNNRTDGTSNVYIGTDDNSRSAFGCIGIRIAGDGLYIMDGTNTVVRGEGSDELMKFQRDDGLTNFYRFAIYVDATGLMTYYIVSLNDGTLSTGTRQCTLTNISTNPKLWMTYDRLSNNTAAIAIGETHLVLNQNQSRAESLWNWRF